MTLESSTEMSASLPVLPLRDVVVYPSMVIPLFVGREKSIRALDAAMEGDKQIVLLAQKSPDTDDPGAGDMYQIGTLATVLQLLKLPDGTIKVLVEGGARVRAAQVLDAGSYVTADVEEIPPGVARDEREIEAASKSLLSMFEQFIKINRKVPPELMTTLAGLDDAGRLPTPSRRTCRSGCRTSSACSRPSTCSNALSS